MNIRVGFGYDVHKLGENRDLVVGGVKIPHHKGCIGHSDGDTLIHAICDALLGAANMRDIGFHFPDTDNSYKNIDSKILLNKVIELLHQEDYKLVNIDSTICLQQPKLKEFIPKMQEEIAKVLSTPVNNIAIKATTTEHLGFVGTEDGIACYAVVLIQKV